MEAYILITTAVGKVRDSFSKIKDLETVKKANIVTGNHDVIALVEGESLTDLRNIIVEELHGIDGVTDTVTAVVTESE